MMLRTNIIQGILWISLYLQVTTEAFQVLPVGFGGFGVARRVTTIALSAIDGFDMDELRSRIAELSNPCKGQMFDEIKSKENGTNKPEFVHIILFNPGTQQQGVHTIEYPKDSGFNVILAFESSIACDKFSASLKKQNFFDPIPQKFNLEELSSICDTLGVFLQFIPEGIELIPPTENKKNLGHDPNLPIAKNDLDYIFEMFDSELEETGVLDGAMLMEYTGSWE